MVRRLRRSSYARHESATTGLPDRTIGLLWLAGGAGVTFVTYAVAAPGGVYIVAWGAMLFGVVKVLGSLGEVHDSEGTPLTYKDRIVLGQEMALRAMFFIARETGGITEASSAMIDRILWRITDKEFPADRRAALLAEAQTEGDAFLDRVRSERDRIAPSFLDIILNCAAQIALAGGPISSDGEAKLAALAQALRLDDAAVKAALDAAPVV